MPKLHLAKRFRSAIEILSVAGLLIIAGLWIFGQLNDRGLRATLTFPPDRDDIETQYILSAAQNRLMLWRTLSFTDFPYRKLNKVKLTFGTDPPSRSTWSYRI